ncbi:MAG: acyl carrier protein [Alphaproteobacteria bacterium]|nr:acyl carrier protein [Alphaproteobacteria bacterium]
MPLTIAKSAEDVDTQTWEKVQEAFAEALGLDEDEVEFHSVIIDELGAESLDFLDIAFRLERAFDIKIPRGGIEMAARDDVGDPSEYEVDGVLTQKALDALAEAMPEIPRAEFKPGLKSNQVAELFRVGTFYNLVVFLVNQKEAA